MLRAVGRTEEASELVADAADPILDDRRPEARAMLGSLRAHAALSAALDHSYGDAWRHWDAAADAVRDLGDYAHPWTVFGAGNLAIHAISVDVELGRYREASERVDSLDLSTVPSSERRSRTFIEGARAHAAGRSDVAALHLLQRAVSESVETVKYAAPVRSLLPTMIARSGPNSRAELVEMADLLAVPV